jgi:demethoxyubiquinone hydroxylase (CLK1/Coq7/Cat5 family)
LAAIGAIDGGRVDAAVKRHLARAIEDCDDRAAESKSRKIVLQIEVKPITHQDGATCDVEITVQVKSVIPTHVAMPVTARVSGRSDAWFNDMSQENPDQRTIDEFPNEAN